MSGRTQLDSDSGRGDASTWGQKACDRHIATARRRECRRRAAHLSADGVGRPQRHGQGLAVAADEVAVMEDEVLGAEEHGGTAVRQVSTVWLGRRQRKRQVRNRKWGQGSGTERHVRASSQAGTQPGFLSYRVSLGSHFP